MERDSGPFCPGASQFAIPINGVSPQAGVQSPLGPSGSVSFVFWNPNSFDAFVSYGNSAADAQAKCGIPTVGNNYAVVNVPAGCLVSYTLNGGEFFSAIASATGEGVIYCTPGAGS